MPSHWFSAAPLVPLALVAFGPSIVAAEPRPKEPLICKGDHRSFIAGDGTYELTLQDFRQGNKRDATVCIEPSSKGSTHNCDRALLRRNAQQWKVGDTWVVNITGDSFIQIWQSEHDDAHAGAPTGDNDCKEGAPSSATILSGTGDFKATILVKKR